MCEGMDRGRGGQEQEKGLQIIGERYSPATGCVKLNRWGMWTVNQ